MAVQAAIHRRNARDFRHRLHLANLPVARLAFYSCSYMCAVIPRDAWQHGIDTNPRNRLLGVGIFGELLNRRLVLRDGYVAFHAGTCSREGHQLPRLGIRVTFLAFQTERQMLFVAVGNGLHRRSVFRRIVGDHLLRRLRCRSRLCGETGSKEEKCHQRRSHRNGSDPSNSFHHELPLKVECPAPNRSNYAFLLTTSSMLVPKSLSITVTAFLPGAPVTEPPGNVVAPVWYKPGIGMRCCAQPGIGRIGPTCDALCAPACALPCQKCGFIRSRSSGLSTNRARILSSVKFGA